MTKEEKSWILYDWANSAFSLMIVTAIFPLFFKQIAGSGGIAKADSTAYLAFGSFLYAMIVGLLSPILGTISDFKGVKKKNFIFFFLVGNISLLTMVLINDKLWFLALISYIIAGVGFAGANIFYDSFLTDVTTRERMDWVSANGFGWGYIGSTIPFLISLGVIACAVFFNIGDGESFFDVIKKGLPPLGVKIAFVITSLWWMIFTIPFLLNVKQKYGIDNSAHIIKDSFKRLWKTFLQISKYKNAFIFLIAYFFYIDGVGTIIKMAAAYGDDMGLNFAVLLAVLLMVQIVAFPFAILYGKLAKKTSTKTMLFAAIFVYIIITIVGFMMQFAKSQSTVIIIFTSMSLLVASSQGGIQALSRSFFGKLIPADQSAEFFGFYNIFGKFAAIMGPLLYGIITKVTQNSSIGIISIILLFITGGGILFFVEENKA